MLGKLSGDRTTQLKLSAEFSMGEQFQRWVTRSTTPLSTKEASAGPEFLTRSPK